MASTSFALDDPRDGTARVPLYRVVATMLLALALFVSVAAPALAYTDDDTGYSGCGNQFVMIKSRAKGSVTHEWPAGTQRIGWFNLLYTYRYSNTSLNSTGWLVGASIDVIEHKTYSYCVSYG